jgi:hypothetical protein
MVVHESASKKNNEKLIATILIHDWEGSSERMQHRLFFSW